ncbi:MAG: protein-glutamate O-methyltransferase [Desulfobulbaceae bacterium]|nr:protein-glutamate O-methyltransferase [Desulfobulbaceae bacterium]
MSDKEFQAFSEFVYTVCGILLPPAKKTMLTSRLMKRLKKLGLRSFSEYYDYINSEEGQVLELTAMINSVTTNKTDFLREPKHFEYLTSKVFPEIVLKERNHSAERRINFWSAGCSSGQEPYTIAIIASEFFEKHKKFSYSITATDISTKVLNTADLAIYEHDVISPLPMPLRKKYLLRGKNNNQVRIIPQLRSRVKFQQLNFMDKKYNFPTLMDIVFCRNVLIYFDKKTQIQVISRICNCLKPGGYLFLGHSETIQGYDLPLQNMGGTIFRKT